MKQLFRCEYCDKIGTEEQIAEHEKEYRNIYQIALDNAKYAIAVDQDTDLNDIVILN